MNPNPEAHTLAPERTNLQGLQRGFHHLLQALAVTGFLAYCLWNAYWLSRGRVPPSMLAAVGLPSPTTGGTRSLLHLGQGNWQASLRSNAMAVPLCLLFLLSVGRLGWQLASRQRLRLPGWVIAAWAVALTAGWVQNLCGDPATWYPH